jgi:tRNA threonylcarbamoyladenosine biosynthesis protein TsaB
MAYLLCIDTAQGTASVCLTNDEKIIGSLFNNEQKDHAAWLHQAIATLLAQQNLSIRAIDAIAVSNGPGSYTGLRVGLSAAKGLCYALNIPLLTISTLKMMAGAIKDKTAGLLCPLIDARRMEVYTAIYTKELNEVLPPAAMIIDENSFASFLSNEILIFTGSGMDKLKKNIDHPNAQFAETVFSAENLVPLAIQEFQASHFADLAYTEPFYIKEFYSPARKPLL